MGSWPMPGAGHGQVNMPRICSPKESWVSGSSWSHPWVSRAHRDCPELLSAAAHALSVTQIAFGRKASPCSEDSKLGSVKWLWSLRNHNKFQEDFGKYSAVSITKNQGELPMADLSRQLFHTAQVGTPSTTSLLPALFLSFSSFHHISAPWENSGSSPSGIMKEWN